MELGGLHQKIPLISTLTDANFIKINDCEETANGFFISMTLTDSTIFKALITNQNTISKIKEKKIDDNLKLIVDKDKFFCISLESIDNERYTSYFNDVVIIEINKDDIIDEEFFLKIRDNIDNNLDLMIAIYNDYKKPPYFGNILDISSKPVFMYSTKKYDILPGSPIFFCDNSQKVVGIHVGQNKESREYYGIFINSLVNKIEKEYFEYLRIKNERLSQGSNNIYKLFFSANKVEDEESIYKEYKERQEEEISKEDSNVNEMIDAEEMEKILPTVVKIKTSEGNISGFLVRIPLSNNNINALITISQVLTDKLIKNENLLKGENNNGDKFILDFNKDRRIFPSYNKNEEIVIIEILEKDGIPNRLFFQIDNKNINKNYFYYNNCPIYIIHYSKSKKHFSQGNIINVSQDYKSQNYYFKYKIKIGKGSLGAPIISINNNSVIGVNIRKNNNGIFLGPIIEKLSKNDELKE